MEYAYEVQRLKQALIEAADLAGRLDARSEQAARRIESSVAALEQAARRLNDGGERFAGEALQRIGAQAHQTLSHGAAQATGEFQNQMQQCAQSAKWAAQAMTEQRLELTAAQKTLVWKGLIALAIGSALVAVGCGFYVRQSLREVEDARFAKDILRATQTGVLTPCGDGALCIKVGAKPRRAGKDGEYVVLVE